MRIRKILQYNRIAMILCLILAFGVMWTSTIKVGAADSNSRTEDLIISTREDLISFAERVNGGNSYSGKTVRLVNDITFDGQVGNFTPISGFSGTFDGGGHVISGIVAQGYNYCGLFESIKGAVIKNVTVKDSEFTCTNTYSNGVGAGAIVGVCWEGEITNCHGIRNSVYINDAGIVGGLVGTAYYDVKIMNCTNRQGSVKGEYSGGILGSGGSAIIKNCANQANVEGSRKASGIAGYASEVQNCYNTGTITCTNTVTGQKACGIVTDVKNSISNCYYLTGTADISYGGRPSIEKNIKSMTVAEMQAQSFLNTLNSNRGDNAGLLSWEFRGTESAYPLLVKVVDISGLSASVAGGTYTYTGEAITPLVTIVNGAYILQADKDYTVSYTDNVNAGNATVTIEGINQYAGGITLPFTIQKATPQFQYTSFYNKNYGDAPISLNVKCTVGDSSAKLTYASSDTSVANVSSLGSVSLLSSGKAIITVSVPETDNYTAGEVKVAITVKPKKVALTVSSGKKKQAYLKWNKNYGISGYEIQYSTNSKFKKAVKKLGIKKVKTTGKKLTKLKSHKKYYIRIRAYKTIYMNGKKEMLYSPWTKKTLRIK